MLQWTLVKSKKFDSQKKKKEDNKRIPIKHTTINNQTQPGFEHKKFLVFRLK